MCCAWQRQIFKKIFCPKNGENGPKIVFLDLLENLIINFFWIWSIKKVHIICCILALIPYLGKTGSWDMGQNALSQSDCRIFKLTISPEHGDEKAWFFVCWYRLMEIKSWLKNIDVGMVKNGCDHSGSRTLKFGVSQKGIFGINWFLVCW